MSKPKKVFSRCLPEESFAIVQEAADRMRMSVKSFVSMATIRYALELKREFKRHQDKGRSTFPRKARNILLN